MGRQYLDECGDARGGAVSGFTKEYSKDKAKTNLNAKNIDAKLFLLDVFNFHISIHSSTCLYTIS